MDKGANVPASDCIVMAPFLDMLNHHPDAVVSNQINKRSMIFDIYIYIYTTSNKYCNLDESLL
jgi:hypothetical protein